MPIINSEEASGFYTQPDAVTGDQTFICAPSATCPFCQHEIRLHDTRGGPSGTRIVHCLERKCRCEYAG